MISRRLIAACVAAAFTLPVYAEQQPFICRSQESGLGPPIVDNHEGIGHPVYDANGQLLGHSRHCKVPVRIVYQYFTGAGFKAFDPATGFTTPPADMKTITVNGETVPFIVRIEGGVINRFLYTIAMLAPYPEADKVNTTAWNKKLVYWLRGGVGIGHQQGLAMWFNDRLNSSEKLLMPKLLEQGYAVVSSSGNETGVHYNMRLAERTANLTKEYFADTYGKPRFTIGLGGSGGAVQQYLFAQNRPGLFDGGVPVQSYPDMVTQTISVADCPLLGEYFKEEVARDPSSPWAKWSNQSWIEGMNASDTARNVVTGGVGSTECINGWATAMPTVLNPLYKDPSFDKVIKAYNYPAEAFADVRWTHWNDLADIYHPDKQGYAPIPLDNVGVQYGLGALAKGQIGTAEFLRINACVGGWKEQGAFVAWNQKDDPNDVQNAMRSSTCREPDGAPAPRRSGDESAMRRAYSSGHVFSGKRLGIPMVDLRPYLEAELNMHSARQPFSVRARLLDGHARDAKNQVIWFAPQDARLPVRVLEAVAVVDRYLSEGSAPEEFADKCFDAAGSVIASGAAAWDGILNKKTPGACTTAYPIYSSPRMVAGESIKGDLFKCALKPVAVALRDGSYPASVQFSAQEKDWLKRIFPQGVCDYSRSRD